MFSLVLIISIIFKAKAKKSKGQWKFIFCRWGDNGNFQVVFWGHFLGQRGKMFSNILVKKLTPQGSAHWPPIAPAPEGHPNSYDPSPDSGRWLQIAANKRK